VRRELDDSAIGFSSAALFCQLVARFMVVLPLDHLNRLNSLRVTTQQERKVYQFEPAESSHQQVALRRLDLDLSRLDNENMSAAGIEEVNRRREALEKDLEKERITADRNARWLEACISVLFWIQMIAGGIASLLGLTRLDWVAPWMVSVIAAVATASAIVVRQAKWREKANWWYALRDSVRALLYRLRYEMPEQITLDNVAAISREFREQRGKLGDRMAAIHAGPPESANKKP
jgi:hypothetical protein